MPGVKLSEPELNLVATNVLDLIYLTSSLPKASLRNILAKITVNMGLAEMMIF